MLNLIFKCKPDYEYNYQSGMCELYTYNNPDYCYSKNANYDSSMNKCMIKEYENYQRTLYCPLAVGYRCECASDEKLSHGECIKTIEVIKVDSDPLCNPNSIKLDNKCKMLIDSKSPDYSNFIFIFICLIILGVFFYKKYYQ